MSRWRSSDANVVRLLTELVAESRARSALLFAGGNSESMACVTVAIDPADPEKGWMETLTGAHLRRDQILANARRQNRPFTIPTIDLPLQDMESGRTAAAIAPWATLIPLFPGKGLDAWIILLAMLPRSGATTSSLVQMAARVAAVVGAATHPVEDSTGPRVNRTTPPPNAAVRLPGAAGAAETPPARTDKARAARSVLPEGTDLLLATARDGIVIADSAGAVVAANNAGLELLSVLQNGQKQIIQLPALQEFIAAASPDQSGEIELTSPGETPRYINAGAGSLPGFELIILTLRDMGRERLLQERLLQSEKMASVGQLVSGVAHELNNPLTGIIGFTQLLLMRDLPPEVRREVTTIHDEAERAARIVQNLLSFSRQRRAERVRVDLNGLIERVIELRSYEFRVRNIEMGMNLAPLLPSIMADSHQIQQVLLNVIGNAEHAIQDRSGGYIQCSTRMTAGSATITIADSGIGISREHLRRVFDPFFTTKEVGEGTGLGLAICYGIIADHGGEITIDSKRGGGTTVTIRLPLGLAGPMNDPPEATSPATAGAPRSRILVVDDELSIRGLLHTSLTAAGHHVETAGDGVNALEYLAKEDVDLIISDVKMPGVDGIELYRRILAWEPRVAARMIFTSGDLLNPQTRSFLDSIPNPNIAKPFDLTAMRDLVDAMLTRT